MTLTNQLYLVRHAENRANLTKELSHYKVDYPLTSKGRLQAEQTAAYFLDRQIEEIYTSPLKRAVETASIIAKRLNLPFTVMENFRELNMGDLEDNPVAPESWRMYLQVLQDWVDGRHAARFPGGEDWYEARQRMRAGIETILAGKTGRNILLVGHGGLINATIRDLCPRITLAELLNHYTQNCSISEIQMRLDGCWTGDVVRWADFSHLQGEAAELVSGLPEGHSPPAA